MALDRGMSSGLSSSQSNSSKIKPPNNLFGLSRMPYSLLP